MALNTIPNEGLTSRGYPSDRIVTPIIINGDMSVAQRATSSTSTGIQTCDRWNVRASNTDNLAITQAQSTEVPGYGFKFSYKYDTTTVESDLASDEKLAIEVRLEANTMQGLKFGTAQAEATTLGFWCKGSLTGVHGIYIRTHDGAQEFVQSYNIDTADTWEFKTINIPANTSKVINNDNGIGWWIQWGLAAGTGVDGATLGSWHDNATEVLPSNQVNYTANTAYEFLLTGVQLEVGEFDSTSIPSFPFESFNNNLRKCQRYYEKSYDYSTTPATNTETGTVSLNGLSTSSKQIRSHDTRYYPKRTAPTVTIYDVAGNSGRWSTYNSAGSKTDNVSGIAVITKGTQSFQVYQNGTVAAGYQYHFTSDAEL